MGRPYLNQASYSLTELFPPVSFLFFHFFLPTIILGSFEHSCDLGRGRTLHSLAKTLGAGAGGVVLVVSGLGPERGCSGQREAGRGVTLQPPAASPLSRGAVPGQKVGGHSTAVMEGQTPSFPGQSGPFSCPSPPELAPTGD